MPTQGPSPGAAELERRVLELTERVRTLEHAYEASRRYGAAVLDELLEPFVMAEAYARAIAARVGPCDEARKNAEAMARTATHARRLGQALWAQTRLGDRPLRRETVDLRAAVAHSLDLLEPELTAGDARVEIAALPTVSGEPALLESVFSNLLANALRYGPRRRQRVRVSAAPELPAQWRVAVDSDGTPIPAEDRERIFTPYQYASNERRRGGVGLGLTICRWVIECHSGRTGVVPLPDGNRFWFTLPADPRHVAPAHHGARSG